MLANIICYGLIALTLYSLYDQFKKGKRITYTYLLGAGLWVIYVLMVTNKIEPLYEAMYMYTGVIIGIFAISVAQNMDNEEEEHAKSETEQQG